MKTIFFHKLAVLLLFMGCSSLLLAQPCLLTHTLSGPVTSNDGYRAQTTIASTQSISAGATVTYDAGTTITMSPGFIAASGSDFHAFIGGCNVSIDDLNAGKFAVANYPNPFSGETRIVYNLVSSEVVSLKVFNAMGQPIATLLDGEARASGEHEVIFDGSQLPGGVYVYTLQAGDKSVMGRMVLQE